MSSNIFGVEPEAVKDPGPAAPSEPVSTPEKQDAPAEASPAPAEPEPPAEPDPGPAEDDEKDFLSPDENRGFRLGERVYKDVAAADHVFRQFRGRARAAEERRKTAEADRDRAAAEASQLRVELDQLRIARAQQPLGSGSPGIPATEPPPPPSKPKRLTELINEDELNSIIASEGPVAAFRKMAELVESRNEQLLEDATRDTKPLVNQFTGTQRAVELFDAATAQKDPSGAPVYPELQDPSSPAGQAVFGIWQRNTNDPALAPLAFTPHALRIAVNEYRAQAANGQPASRAPRTEAGQAVVARRAADASLQSMGVGGRSALRPSPGPVESNEEAVRRIESSRRHDIFGVSVER